MIAALPPPQPCALPVARRFAVDSARHQQVIIAAGHGRRSSHATLTRWVLRQGCWTKVASTPARNGARGWHPRPWDYSYYSPIGVFGLTDAGGQLPKPRGTRLPYDHDRRGFAAPSPGVFDYVVAVNFNRVPGRSPLDLTRPNPRINDGGIWLHVAGTGATRGCISISRAQMRATLRWLDPASRPVIVMGPRAVLRG
jgi:L,D-peptidoglycan transpeptidase YkuD (ErfK/YbiS/YcfS/YnhG family)